MYTVQELSTMYKCTRKTMYSKLENKDIQPFVVKTEKGIKLMPEGLGILNIIIADSKVSREQEANNIAYNKITPDIYKYFDMYTEQLKIQILELTSQNTYLKEQMEELKKEKDEIKHERQALQIRHDQLVNMMINRQQQLAAPKGFFSRVFKPSQK